MKAAGPQLLLLLLGASLRASDAAVHLYVRDRYANATRNACATCSDEGNGCHLIARSFYLQKMCHNRGDGKASIYNELGDGTNTVCRQDFRESCEDLERAFDAEDVGDCKDDWTLNQCVEGEVMTKFSNHCEESETGPMGEYTVPLVNFQEYFGVEACGSEDFHTVLVPDDGGACVPYVYDDNGTLVDGSRRFGCGAGGRFNAMRYNSADCSGTASPDPFNGSSDTCPAAVLTKEYVHTHDCGSTAVYCKPLPSEIAGSGDGSYWTNEAGRTQTSSVILLVLGMAVLSWMT
ncbi:hypothetical protein ACHAXT_002114 [Thalassiosira profunda]